MTHPGSVKTPGGEGQARLLDGIHDQLHGGDLFDVANLIADLVGGPTVIMDAYSNVLAYSEHDLNVDVPRQKTILERRAPGDWVSRFERDGFSRRVREANDVVRVEYPNEPDFHPRLVIGLRVANEFIGAVWVLESGQTFDAHSEKVLADVSHLVPARLLRLRAYNDGNCRSEDEDLQSVLTGKAIDSRRVAALGVTAHNFSTVLALGIQSPDGQEHEADVLALASRVLHAIRIFYAARPEICAAVIGSTVYVLVTTLASDGIESCRIAAELSAQICEGLPSKIRIGIGSTGQGSLGVAASREDADRVLRVMTNVDGPVSHFDDLVGRMVLARLNNMVRDEPWLIEGRVSQLFEHDKRRNTHYVTTLRAFFDANCDIRRAADALFVHPNTLRYRLVRLQEAVNLNLDDPDERLAAQLQLRFIEGQAL